MIGVGAVDWLFIAKVELFSPVERRPKRSTEFKSGKGLPSYTSTQEAISFAEF